MPPVNRESLIACVLMAALGLCALPMCAWFVVNSSPFTNTVQEELDRETKPGIISFEKIEWGPHPYAVTIYNAVLRHRSGAPILQADRVRARLNVDRFHSEEYALTLVVDEVEIEDFELTLAWNRFGDFNLVEMFQGRAFALAVERRPDLVFQLELPDVSLRGGLLHLVWPTFGFTFTDIATTGAVTVSKPTGLIIDVPALDTAQSVAWFRKSPPTLREQLTSLMPANAPSDAAPQGLRLPISQIAIRDFDWAGDGFNADLRVVGSGGLDVRAAGSMGWPDDGTRHAITADVTVPQPFAKTLSRGAVDGRSTVKAISDGLDLQSRFALGPVVIPAIRAGGVEVDDLQLRTLAVDASDSDKGDIQLDAGARRLAVRGVVADDLAVTSTVKLGLGKRTVADLAAVIANPPTSVAGWLRFVPKLVTISSLRASRLTRGATEIRNIAIRDVRVEPTINFLSLSLTVEVRFRDVPLLLARQLLPAAPELADWGAKTVSGTFTATAGAPSFSELETTLTLEPAL